jgi:hypothetical protein
MKFTYKKDLADRLFLAFSISMVIAGMIPMVGILWMGIDIDHPWFWPMLWIDAAAVVILWMFTFLAPLFYNARKRNKVKLDTDITQDAIHDANPN